MKLRDKLNMQFGKIEEIADATGIDVNDLRRFGIGTFILEKLDLDTLADYFGLFLQPHTPSLLPEEDWSTLVIQREFKEDFAVAAKVIKAARELIGSRDNGSGSLPPIKNKNAMSRTAMAMYLGLYTKIVKQCRSILMLCESGLVDDAAAIERCMFEAVLALNYLLRPRVKLKQNGVELSKLKSQVDLTCQSCKAVVKKAKVFPPLKKLTSRLRAVLYAGHICRETIKYMEACKKAGLDPIWKDLGDPAVVKASADRASKHAGPGWLERQKQTGFYMGVSTADLAESYGYKPYYTGVYKMQSWTVHGVDATSFFDSNLETGDLKLNLGPDVQGLRAVCMFAASLLVNAMELINFRFGYDSKEKIKSLVKEVKARQKLI